MIPAHWLDKVREDLKRDIALVVIERIPQNAPSTWCSQMNMVGKKMGEPRRVVDCSSDSLYGTSIFARYEKLSPTYGGAQQTPGTATIRCR